MTERCICRFGVCTHVSAYIVGLGVNSRRIRDVVVGPARLIRIASIERNLHAVVVVVVAAVERDNN